MSTVVTLQTKDGRIIQGINYVRDSTSIPKDINRLAAAMQGGMSMGTYHIQTPYGWQYVPASQIAAVLNVKQGAQT